MGFDAARKEYVDLVEAGIIDPTKVVRVALENAVSVASLLLLTEATLTERAREEGGARRGARLRGRLMLVRDVMQAHPVTATPETRLSHLLRVLQQRGFRHVPIVDGDRLIGIVSDRDVKQAMASAAQSADGRERERLIDGLTAGGIMTRSAG